MATTINGSTTTQYWTFKLVATEGAVNVAANTSPLTVDLYIGRHTVGSYMYAPTITGNVSVTGAGSKSFTFDVSYQIDIAAGGWYKIGSVSFPSVPHDADGSKTVTVSASFTNNIKPASGSASGTVKLTTIARASQPSCIKPYPNHQEDVGEFGDTITIYTNAADSSFEHAVYYEWGKTKKVITPVVFASTTWQIPETFMNDIPNATSGSGLIHVDTYASDGNTLIGSKYCGFTATVPAEVKPELSVKLEDITGVDDIYGSPVKGLSKIKVIPTVTLGYKSPIDYCSITIDGVKYEPDPSTDMVVTTGALQKAGSSPVTVTVRDTRGRTDTWTYTMNVQDYTPPRVVVLDVRRTDESMVENDQGTHATVTFTTAVSSMNSKNTATYKLEYKKTTESEDDYQEIDISELNNNFNVMNHAVVFPADVSSSYDVRLTVTDRHDSAVRTTSVSTAFSLMDWHASGTGLRFGGVAELENTLQNDLSLRQAGNRYAFSTPGIANEEGLVCVARITITAANADTPIAFVLSRRQEAAPMTVYVTLKNASMTTSSVSSIRYEGENYGAFLHQFDTLTWDLYVGKGSAWDTITLQDWYTSKSMESRVKVTFPGGLVDAVPTPFWRATPLVARSILDCFMPVGYVLTLYDDQAERMDPNVMYPGTTWVRLEETFLWATGANGEIGQTGGEKTHTLTVSEIPSHNHGSYYSGTAGVDTGGEAYKYAWYLDSGNKMTYGTFSRGGGAAHNNMPPYTQVSMWRRTA